MVGNRCKNSLALVSVWSPHAVRCVGNHQIYLAVVRKFVVTSACIYRGASCAIAVPVVRRNVSRKIHADVKNDRSTQLAAAALASARCAGPSDVLTGRGYANVNV